MSALNPTHLRAEVRRYFQDGLFELAFGVAMILLLGLMLVPDVPFFMVWYLPWMVVYLMLPQAKKNHAVPRGGLAEMPLRNRSTLKASLVLAGLVALLAGIFVLTLTRRQHPSVRWLLNGIEWGVAHAPLMMGAILALVFGIFAYRGRIARFVAFAALSALAGLVATLLIQSLRQGAGVVFGLVGAAVLVSGTVLFARFRQSHPVVDRSREG